jgi:DNA helicase-2/ATP-dependent DNA helicase PcrA
MPYRIYKGSSFYDHKEIKDILAYIRLVINPKDDEAFKRVVNYPLRGIGDTTVSRIAQLAAERGQSMWESVDALVAEAATLGDPMQRTIARKVTEFVNLIRSLQLARAEKSLYDFGLDLASRTGILAQYRTESTPEATSAIENIEELLNGMQLFTEQCEAEIRAGEREEDRKPTVEEWLQNIMLLTDMDNKEDEGDERITLMTVHSSKGLEYKYIYIVGCEDKLFPSERAMESADGLEEERRLFYVALTRAKAEATLSYCDMRFKWGNMEFSQPSRFLREIDPRYVECDEDLSARPPRAAEGEGEGLSGRMGSFSRGGYGGPKPAAQRTEERRDGRTAIEELRRRFDVRFQQKREQATQKPDPRIVAPIEPRSTEGLKRVSSAPASSTPLGACPYAVGDRVEHPKFGVGVVRRVEMMATDHKVVVDFGQYGEKTLLAKFAKLQKL